MAGRSGGGGGRGVVMAGRTGGGRGKEAVMAGSLTVAGVGER